MEPFLQNHQYNVVAQQAQQLMNTLKTCTNGKVVEAARHSAVGKAIEACPGIDGEQLQLVKRVGVLNTNEEFHVYLNELSRFTFTFPALSEHQLQRLFPKVKKLRIPDLAAVEGRPLTYLGWLDPATNKQYLVYLQQSDQRGQERSGSFVGIEGRYTPMNKKGLCAFCKRHGEAALFTAVTKAKVSHMPDYYKSVGQYICMDSEACNARITELDAIGKFFSAVLA